MTRLSIRLQRATAILLVAMTTVTACNRSRSQQAEAVPATLQAAKEGTLARRIGAVPTEPQAAIETVAEKNRSASFRIALDPSLDGWTSEAISDLAEQRLTALLGQALRSISSGDTSESSMSINVVTSRLRPRQLEERQLAGDLVVRIANQSELGASPTNRPWAEAAAELFAPLQGMTEVKAKVKTTQIELRDPSPDYATTRSLIEISARERNHTMEQHFTWSCQWQLQQGGPPRLRSIAVEDFQETESQGRWFVDRSWEVMHGESAYQQQLRHGLNHWLPQIEVTHGMHVFAEYGLAVADVNDDGREDVYVCQPGGLPNRLLVQKPDGTIVDIAQEAGVAWLDHTSSALFVDFDNDGDQDLAIAIENRRVLLMKNSGQASFHLAQELLIEDRHVQGLCAADFDNDSRVDLYLTVGFADERARRDEPRTAFVYHDANEGGANVLFKNRQLAGRWQFVDVTREVGLDENNRRHSLAAAWEDFDNDGDQDLYVANDYGQNCLYRNDGGLFTDVAAKMGVVDFGSGMSVSWSDYDRDGWMDLYVGNMFSAAGRRVTGQDTFRPEADEATRGVLERFAKGNTLFRNQAGRSFEEPQGAADVQMGRWAWSAPFGDLNNDGWPDVLVANGYVTGNDERDL